MLALKDKKITLMGLGLLGRGVNVAQYLLQNGAQLTVTDLKTESELQASIDQLRQYSSQITYILGRHRIKDFVEADLVVKGPGVNLDNKYIKAAKDNNVPVKMDASWCVSELPDEVITIGVTGTKGKSTVSHMIKYLLDQAGIKSYLGGNVRGQATLPLLDVIQPNEILVLELDSWQLQGFHDEKLSPHIAVFTNFMPDHLNYYKGMPEYFFDKSAIYRYQNKKDYLVLSLSSFDALRKFDPDYKPAAMTAIVKPNILMKDWLVSQPGEHNRLNAAQVYQVGKFMKIDDQVIKEALETFPGVPGRLQKIATISGIDYYNDTNATTPEATVASVKAISSQRNKSILICGGVSKNFPSFQTLIDVINTFTGFVVLLPGGIADSIKRQIKLNYLEVSDMSEAVIVASAKANELGLNQVIMSPAGSSFGLFKNEYDRGEQFVQVVEGLQKTGSEPN